VNRKLFDDRMVLVSRRNHSRVTAHPSIERLRKEELIGLRRLDVEYMPQALRLHNLESTTRRV
jgi:DNA-binding transcriptional LysR family regulator